MVTTITAQPMCKYNSIQVLPHYLSGLYVISSNNSYKGTISYRNLLANADSFFSKNLYWTEYLM